MSHDYKCQVCGHPAEINYQHTWVSWDITDDGNFTNMEFHNCNENEFYCSNCWNIFGGVEE